MAPSFRLLVITDVHYSPAGALGEHACPMGAELVRRVVEDAKLRGGFDAIALLGDLLNDGDAPGSVQALAEMNEQIRKAAPDAPLMVVPGNHDGPPEGVFAAFGDSPGLHEIGGYRFVTFLDDLTDAGRVRSEADRRKLAQWAARSDAPLVVLQHYPAWPHYEECMALMLANHEDVARDYARAGVLLAVSGHIHPGQPLCKFDGVQHYTVPCLAHEPFPYAVIELDGRNVSVLPRQLQLDGTIPVIDRHVHTEFAYCSRDLTAQGVVERSRLFGLAGVTLVEHAGQLYVSGDEFWSAAHVHNPAVWRKKSEHYRMDKFREKIGPLRDGYVRIGMEVEVGCDGCLTMHDEDIEWVDLLVGAVHWLVEDIDGMTPAQETAAFMRTVRLLLEAGVDVLAHPLRYLNKFGRRPKEVYADVADMLAGTGTAVEINYHHNGPDPEFLAICIDRGVKISLGSDGHNPCESAAFNPHLDLLRRIAGTRDPAELLLERTACKHIETLDR